MMDMIQLHTHKCMLSNIQVDLIDLQSISDLVHILVFVQLDSLLQHKLIRDYQVDKYMLNSMTGHHSSQLASTK